MNCSLGCSLARLWTLASALSSSTSITTNPTTPWNATAMPPEEHILSNAFMRVGVDFTKGGSLSYLADPAHPNQNVINSYDEGREVQLSFYSGPTYYNPTTKDYPFGACRRWFQGKWPWNPIGAGDAHGQVSDILDFQSFRNNSMTIHTRPYQWFCHSVPCECTFTKVIELLPDKPVVKVTATLQNARTDDYDEEKAMWQELPAVFTNAFLSRLVTYNGTQPFTNDSLAEYVPSFAWGAPQPWVPGGFPATEHWAAMVNKETGWGLGVVNPQVKTMVGGFCKPSHRGQGGPADNQAGYMAPVAAMALPRNVTYTYEFYLVLGHVEEIRKQAIEIVKDYRKRKGEDLLTMTSEDDTKGLLEAGQFPLRHPGILSSVRA